MKQFKIIMSSEKAKLFKKHPELVLRLIEFSNNNVKIDAKNIYFKRTDKNLRMNMVVLFVDYDIIHQ